MTKRKITFLSISVAMMVTLLGGALFAQSTQKTNVYRYLSIFSEVFDLVRSNYVEQVSSDQLMDGAFSGVTDAIDEFSYYVPPAQMAAYKNYVDIDDNGLGIVMTKRFGYAYIIAAVPGSPADKAGIERGSFIEAVNGTPTQKLAVWQVRNALRSDKPVKLQVLRSGETRREEVTVQPGQYHPLALETKTISNVAYIKVPYFEKGTAAQFRAALDEVRRQNQRKLIVDLRGNAGGSIDEAIAAADELLTSGLITSLEGRKTESKRWQADRNTSYDGAVEVLTDMTSAAGAEVFAGAIRGNQRGKVIGSTTYGKAIQQKFIPLPSGGGVHMTVAHYTTPDLKPIKETGVKPDVTVDLSAQYLRDPKDTTARTKPDQDLILEKALELFGAEVEPKKAARLDRDDYRVMIAA
ncbi:MAG TPA: S41 family peptidase [Thermoanaerobaculia bacterium]|jgi:carboxyl-terminal processing protease